MKFFQKRWVAITLCVLMIVAALAIGQAKNSTTEYQPGSSTSAKNWQEENYGSYTRYIRDDAGLLSDETIRRVAEYNASSDYSYGSICGLWIAEDLGGEDLEELAFDYADELGLGSSDFFLLLDAESEDWYFACGDEVYYYKDNQLEILVIGAVSAIFTDTDEAVLELYEELFDWYAEELPLADAWENGSDSVMIAGGSVFFVGLIVLLVIAAVFSAMIRAGKRFVGRAGSWWPVLFLTGRRRHDPFGPAGRPGPGPRNGPRPGGPSRFSGGPRSGGAGGFGSSSRGGFNRGGGFGGGNRGGRGGFGGKR